MNDDSRRDVLVVVAAFVLVGLVDNYLVNAGETMLAVAVFTVGYASIVLAVWYRWLRHVEFSGGGDAGWSERPTDAGDGDDG